MQLLEGAGWVQLTFGAKTYQHSVEGLDLGLSPLLCCLLVSLVVRQDGTGWLHGKALWENGQNELILKPFHFQLCWDCSVSKLKLLFLVASAITMPKASQC